MSVCLGARPSGTSSSSSGTADGRRRTSTAHTAVAVAKTAARSARPAPLSSRATASASRARSGPTVRQPSQRPGLDAVHARARRACAPPRAGSPGRSATGVVLEGIRGEEPVHRPRRHRDEAQVGRRHAAARASDGAASCVGQTGERGAHDAEARARAPSSRRTRSSPASQAGATTTTSASRGCSSSQAVAAARRVAALAVTRSRRTAIPVVIAHATAR